MSLWNMEMPGTRTAAAACAAQEAEKRDLFEVFKQT